MADIVVKAKADSGKGLADVSLRALAEVNSALGADLRKAIRAGLSKSRTWLRGNAPKDTGDYAGDFRTSFKDGDGHCEGTVYNDKHWQITHLLEDGHDSWNQYGGPYGEVAPADPEHHMQRAQDVGVTEIKRRLGMR